MVFPYFEEGRPVSNKDGEEAQHPQNSNPTVDGTVVFDVAIAAVCAEWDRSRRDGARQRLQPKLAEVQVEVLRNGEPYDAVSTLSSGKYSLSLDHGADYELRFTFGDLSPRRVELQTSSIPEEFRERPFYLTVEMSMFEIPPGFDESLAG